MEEAFIGGDAPTGGAGAATDGIAADPTDRRDRGSQTQCPTKTTTRRRRP